MNDARIAAGKGPVGTFLTPFLTELSIEVQLALMEFNTFGFVI